MTRMLVLYYSAFGHLEAMASAVAAGARSTGAGVTVKRVPETMPEAVASDAGCRLDQQAPVASVAELPDYDAIVIGTPTRFGNMAAQMKQFLDQAGGLWAGDRLVGKVGSVFTATGSQQGGQAPTILSTQVALLHLGMVIVGLPYTFKGQLRMDEISGGSPYGASSVAGEEGSGNDRPTANELDGARFQGRHVARITDALVRGQRQTAIA